MGNRLSAEASRKETEELIAIYNSAFDYIEQGRWDEAEQPAYEAVIKYAELFGSHDSLTLQAMEQLVISYKGQGKLKDAEMISERVVKERQKALGPEDPVTLESETILASIFCGQGRYTEAEELGRRVLEAKTRVLGKDDRKTFTSAANLVVVLSGQKRWLESEQMARQILPSGVRLLGNEHRTVLNLQASLAAVLIHQGKELEATELLVQVVETKRRLNPEHPDTLETMNSLAMCYYRQGFLKEAENVQLISYNASLKGYGMSTLLSKECVENLALIFGQQGRDEDVATLKRQLVWIETVQQGQINLEMVPWVLNGDTAD